MSVEIAGDSQSKKLKQNDEDMDTELVNSISVAGSTSSPPNLDIPNGSNTDVSYHDDNDVDDIIEDDDVGDVDDYGYDDDDNYMFDNDDCDDNYLSLQAHFDNVDLPPGVEAYVSWMKQPNPSSSFPAASSTSVQDAGPSASVVDLGKGKANVVAAVPSSAGEVEVVNDDEVMRKFHLFKQFDTVEDLSDHHYANSSFSGQHPPSRWIKKIQEEWKILERDLPDTIYVRVCEKRMDLLRAVIVGPAGTPYHDGVFVFDVLFPPTYPDIPPMVYYYSGGLRLNPNLYDCGKVCLSLLNTWTGKGNEKWMPKTSTMLQVLVSTQALILNARPFFNEPGHDTAYVGEEGEKRSKDYNEDVFILSLKTMVYTIRRPPKHFEDLVAGHFHSRGHNILSACKAYMEGFQVGSLVDGRVPDSTVVNTAASQEFKAAMGRMINGLINNFTKYGAKDCDQFRVSH